MKVIALLAGVVATVSAFGGTESETMTSETMARYQPMMMGTAGDALTYGGGGGGSTQCPTGYNFADYGDYCISGDLYYCQYAGAPAQLKQTCWNGCQVAPPGSPDYCKPQYSSPTPWPTPGYSPPTDCSRPQWYGGNGCEQFGDFKGKDLAWQSCNPMMMGAYGGGGSQDTCQAWQNQACFNAYDTFIRNCCPYQSTSNRQYCTAYSG